MHIYLMLPVIAVAIRRKPRITRVLLLGLSGAIYLFILLDRPRLDILDPLALLRCLAGFSLGVCLEQGTNIWSRLSRPAATIAQVLSLAAIIAVLLSPLHDVYIIPAFADRKSTRLNSSH